MGRSSAYVYLSYQDETAFLTPPASLTRVLGMEQKVTNVTPKMNLMSLQGLNSNVIQQFAWGQGEGTWDGEWVLSNPWFMNFICDKGSPFPSGSTAPYTYSWTGVSRAVTSFTAEIGFTAESANIQRQLLGSVLGSLRISSRVNEFVRCSANFKYGKENTPGTTINSSPPSDSLLYPYTFVQATLQIPNATTLAEVQSFELSINPNIQYIYGQNSQWPVGVYRGLTEITGRFSINTKDATWLTNVLARSEIATATMIFDNGLSGASQKKLTINLTGVGLDTESTAYNPNEIVAEDIPLTFRSMTATALNPVSVAP